MSLLHAPTVLFYRLSPLWAVTLPVAAIVYILATIDSARLYWQGKGGQWTRPVAGLTPSMTK